MGGSQNDPAKWKSSLLFGIFRYLSSICFCTDAGYETAWNAQCARKDVSRPNRLSIQYNVSSKSQCIGCDKILTNTTKQHVHLAMSSLHSSHTTAHTALASLNNYTLQYTQISAQFRWHTVSAASSGSLIFHFGKLHELLCCLRVCIHEEYLLSGGEIQHIKVIL